jgi:hypothetical protein
MKKLRGEEIRTGRKGNDDKWQTGGRGEKN